MNTVRLSNIPLRTITIQTHVDPVPEHVVKNSLDTLGVSRKAFESWLLARHKKHKESSESESDKNIGDTE